MVRDKENITDIDWVVRMNLTTGRVAVCQRGYRRMTAGNIEICALKETLA
jgi:hypothetical protein